MASDTKFEDRSMGSKPEVLVALLNSKFLHLFSVVPELATLQMIKLMCYLLTFSFMHDHDNRIIKYKDLEL